MQLNSFGLGEGRHYLQPPLLSTTAAAVCAHGVSAALCWHHWCQLVHSLCSGVCYAFMLYGPDKAHMAHVCILAVHGSLSGMQGSTAVRLGQGPLHAPRACADMQVSSCQR